ncbi:MAG: response regulator transcription factor [Methanospirillaceae archaeon]|nr:response regulator transcription factor [Methanospirillaceae archaeon]
MMKNHSLISGPVSSLPGNRSQFEPASSALIAKEMLKESSFDAVVSDYDMPEMNGIAFLKTIRSEYNDVPFILFTGKGREEVVIDAINNGADFYVQKGGDPKTQFAELAHKIRQAVDKHQAFATIREKNEEIKRVDEEARIFVSLQTREEIVSHPGDVLCGCIRDSIIVTVPSSPDETVLIHSIHGLSREAYFRGICDDCFLGIIGLTTNPGETEFLVKTMNRVANEILGCCSAGFSCQEVTAIIPAKSQEEFKDTLRYVRMTGEPRQITLFLNTQKEQDIPFDIDIHRLSSEELFLFLDSTVKKSLMFMEKKKRNLSCRSADLKTHRIYPDIKKRRNFHFLVLFIFIRDSDTITGIIS